MRQNPSEVEHAKQDDAEEDDDRIENVKYPFMMRDCVDCKLDGAVQVAYEEHGKASPQHMVDSAYATDAIELETLGEEGGPQSDPKEASEEDQLND